jgi:hypothetical protein
VRCHIRLVILLIFALLHGSCGVTATSPHTSLHPAIEKPVFITVIREGRSVLLEARQGTETRRAGPFSGAWFETNFEKLFRIMEDMDDRSSREAEMRSIVDELSEDLMLPLEPLIDSSSEIIFVISESELKFPFDILEIRSRPLFLTRPVSYRFGEIEEAPFAPSREWTAFVVSDETADPDRACRALMKLFTRVTYRDQTEVDVEALRDAAAADVVVMSVHGEIGGEDEDNVGLADDEAAVCDDFSSLRPRLIYLDSCNLGISESFLAEFRAMGTRYYLAPIFGNEAGQSSTQTMTRFFGHLMEGETPERALFLTRRELFELYKNNQAMTRLWRAFPFRVYRLN